MILLKKTTTPVEIFADKICHIDVDDAFDLTIRATGIQPMELIYALQRDLDPALCAIGYRMEVILFRERFGRIDESK